MFFFQQAYFPHKNSLQFDTNNMKCPPQTPNNEPPPKPPKDLFLHVNLMNIRQKGSLFVYEDQDHMIFPPRIEGVSYRIRARTRKVFL